MSRPKIATCLWFDSQAEEAARFYVSLLPQSRITGLTPGPQGGVLVVEFELAGVPYLALNGGPHFHFSEAISLSVNCADQAEVDRLWEQLTQGGSESRCGWLKDRYGLSWQIVPAVLSRWLADPQRAGAVMQVLLTMTKLDIQRLQAAYEAA
ncbi:MAG: VOC family protein [Pirellulales bacterium]